MERELSIVNGGDIVGLNGFAKAIVTSTILGMLKSLRDVDVDREIRITISAAGGRAGSRDRKNQPLP